MKRTKLILSAISALLSLTLLIGMVPHITFTASAESGSASFPVNYDPNDGMIKYGHTGEVGMRAENDVNNHYEKTDKVVNFPEDLINLKDENGQLKFPDYNAADAYYDYSDMFNEALSLARAKDNCDVFVQPGVYYFTKSVYLWGYTRINAIAGQTAFVIKPNFQDKDGNPVDVNGFFTNADLSSTYSWYFSSINDIAFVVEGTHSSFKPTNTAQNIIANLCTDGIQAVDKFNLFYRVRIKYGAVNNIGASGFESFMRWSYVDMLTRIQDVTIGPTKYVYYGVETNDAFFYDNHYYGGYYTDSDGYSQLPLFQINFSMGTTMFTNSYIGNYYFSRSGASAWCPHTSYSNLTFERVYNFVMDTTVDSSSSVSGCLFKDGAYNDIAAYFESQGILAFDYWDRTWSHEENRFIYNSRGYIIRDTITGNKLDSANHAHGQYITLIELHNGISFTQNKIECDSLDWTTLVKLTDSEWTSRYTARRSADNITFADNAFKINEWVKEDLFIDDWKGGKPLSDDWYDKTIIVWGERGWNNSDGTPAMGWVGADGPEDVSWMEGYVYVSPYYSRYLDFTAFSSPTAPTAGYAALGAVGADEQALEHMGVEDRYYYDLNSPAIEKVYFERDFGGFSWNTGSNHQKLQEAFDYAATHDAILYIESGTFYTSEPIVLRGGATYRVVFNGTIRSHKTAEMDGTGMFVMSADDNTPINGYFIGTDLYLQNCNTSGFFNVNTDNFYFNIGSVQRGVGCFTNCKLNNTIIHEGQIQYCDYGFFYKTVTNNTLVKNVYGTASTWIEGADGISPGDKNYRYFISDSDFAHSTWRGCWLEFGQFSNGRTLTGAGNSVYRGNLIDYTYNYSFGRNDVFCGNTLTRASYSNITNHMVNSNFPIDLPDILTDKPMVMFHVSDGLRLIGNMDIGTMNEMTHFVEFDSPGISYTNQNGNIVKSISDTRILGNGVTTAYYGDYKVSQPYIPWGKTDDIVFENCKNNVIDLLHFYEIDQQDDPETAEDETFIIPKNELINNSIPRTRFYVNGELIVVDYPVIPEQNLTQAVTPQPPQDEIFDVPNKWTETAAETEYRLYDFKNKSDAELEQLKNIFAGFIDESTIYVNRNSAYNKAVLPDSAGVAVEFTYDKIKDLPEEQRFAILKTLLHYETAVSPGGNKSFYTDQSRDHTDFDSTNYNTGNLCRPTFAIVFDDPEISGDNLVGVTGSLHYNFRFSYAWLGKRQMILVHSEDANFYYGVAIGYSERGTGFFTVPCKIEKNALHRVGVFDEWTGTHVNVGSDRTNHRMYDPFGRIYSPKDGSYSYDVFGDYTEIPMFNREIELFESLIFGVDFTMEYNEGYDSVSIFANIDFSNAGEDEGGYNFTDTGEYVEYNPPLKATTRKVSLGTFDLAGNNKVFGIWGGDQTWIESVQFEYKPQTMSTCDHSFTNTVTRQGACTTDSMVKYTCVYCGYEYEKTLAATGHRFVDRINNDGTALRTCSVCGFAYGTSSADIESCSHVYTRIVINELTCFADGIYQYICDYCDDSYTEIEKTTGHNYKTTVIRPTATKPGYSIHECERCGDSYTDNYTDAAGNPANMGNNRIIGINDGAVYTVGETITFRAIGDGMDDTDDIYSTRFIPVSWSVNPSGTWNAAPYTATFTIENVGSYTLGVKFREEKFQNGEWVETGSVNEKTVSFSVVEKSNSGSGTPPPYVPPVTEKPVPDSPSNPSNPSNPVVTVTTSATTVTEKPDEETTEPEEETDEFEEEITDIEEDTDTTKPADDEEDEAESEEETLENEETDGNPITGVLVSFGGVLVSFAALVITKKKR